SKRVLGSLVALAITEAQAAKAPPAVLVDKSRRPLETATPGASFLDNSRDLRHAERKQRVGLLSKHRAIVSDQRQVHDTVGFACVCENQVGSECRVFTEAADRPIQDNPPKYFHAFDLT